MRLHILILSAFLLVSQIGYADQNDRYFACIPEVGARIGDGRSYDVGYATIGAFIGTYCCDSGDSYFLDFDFHRVEDGRLATNVGVGWRTFSPFGGEIFGVNVYYDTRHLVGTTLQQIGVGFELLGKCWDIRGNGYIPIGKQQALVGSSLEDFSPPFFVVRDDFKSAMWGLDVEVGKYFCSGCCGYLYGAIGPYFYDSLCCNSIVGGIGRLSAELTCGLSVDFFVSYDEFFGTKVQGQVTLAFPGVCIEDLWRCLFRPVRRNEVIVVENISCFTANF